MMKSKYLSSAVWLIISSALVKIIGAFFKIPLTAYIGALGRGYFATAYNLYIPVHAVVMGAFPIAMSRLVSKYSAYSDNKMLSSLKKGADSLFLFIGIGGSALIIVAAKPYCNLVAESPKSLYTVLVLAPGILFSCLSSSYRGYFEGLMNMKPTAVSQSLEALFKLVFGILFARYEMTRLYSIFIDTGCVNGVKVSGEGEALSIIYPYTSASAMLGVTLGSLISLIYLFAYYRINRNKAVIGGNAKQGRRELLTFSFPIMISCAIQSVFQFLDTASIQFSISRINPDVLKNTFSSVDLSSKDLNSYAYGVFSAALDFKNLIPGITMALGITAVPAICRVYEENNYERLYELTNKVFKYTSLLSLYFGGFIFLCANDILFLFYGKSSPDLVTYSESLTKYFAISAVFYSLASSAVFIVQALGVPEKSVKSYAVSGIIRIVLNIILVRINSLLLNGAVISGATGYFVLYLMNKRVIKHETQIKFDLINIVLKPLTIEFVTIFLCKLLFSALNYNNFSFVNLLIEGVIFSVIFCMLCLMMKALKFDKKILTKKVKKMA